MFDSPALVQESPSPARNPLLRYGSLSGGLVHWRGRGLGYRFGASYSPLTPWPRARLGLFAETISAQSNGLFEQPAPFGLAESLRVGGAGIQLTQQVGQVVASVGLGAYTLERRAPDNAFVPSLLARQRGLGLRYALGAPLNKSTLLQVSLTQLPRLPGERNSSAPLLSIEFVSRQR